MDLEIVAVTDADWPEVFVPLAQAFGRHRFDEEELDDNRLNFDDCTMVGARQDGRWVGTLATYPFELALPGGGSILAPGISMAGVLPTHRRRGVLSALVDRVLDDVVAAGAAVSVLLAQEAGIYGRFGFGVATQFAEVHLEAPGVVFDPPLEDTGTFVMPDADEASALAEQVWARARSWRPGTLTRRPWSWEHLRRDRASRRGGGGRMGWVVHLDAEGAPDGYAAYWITAAEDAGRARSVLRARDLIGVDADVEALLLDFLARVDLVHRVELVMRPLDDPLRWRLVDRRELVIREVGDFLWLRVLDVPAAFAARTYGSRDRLVLEVQDDRRPQAGGRFAFDGGPAGGSCERTTEEPDLRLGVAELGSLLLGSVPPSLLAAARRVHGEPEVLARADAFFGATPAPFCTTGF